MVGPRACHECLVRFNFQLEQCEAMCYAHVILILAACKGHINPCKQLILTIFTTLLPMIGMPYIVKLFMIWTNVKIKLTCEFIPTLTIALIPLKYGYSRLATIAIADILNPWLNRALPILPLELQMHHFNAPFHDHSHHLKPRVSTCKGNERKRRFNDK